MQADVAEETVVVVGASGGIGNAVLHNYLAQPAIKRIYAYSRSHCPADLGSCGERLQWTTGDYSEASIGQCVQSVSATDGCLRRVVICNGVLHGEQFSPEKSIDRISAAAMMEVFQANVVVPSLWLAALPQALTRGSDCKIAALSARVGSIGDNRLGGWYSYRASKAALNMVMKSAAIEYSRRLPGVKLMAFHPGTTDTALSRPFQRGVPQGKLFAPDFVAQRLTSLLDTVEADGELSFLDWDGKEIAW